MCSGRGNDIRASIGFVDATTLPPDGESIFSIAFTPSSWSPESPKSNYEIRQVDNILIRDVRRFKDKLSLDKEGFVVLETKSTAFNYDGPEDDEVIRTVFAPKVREELRVLLGAKYVYFHECLVNTTKRCRKNPRLMLSLVYRYAKKTETMLILRRRHYSPISVSLLILAL